VYSTAHRHDRKNGQPCRGADGRPQVTLFGETRTASRQSETGAHREASLCVPLRWTAAHCERRGAAGSAENGRAAVSGQQWRLRPLTFLAWSQPRLARGTVGAARTDCESITAADGSGASPPPRGPGRAGRR
jgi:hypothetical protein